MKKTAIALLVLSSFKIVSQNNTFPATGDVGIGFWGSPSAKLHVQDNSSINTTIGNARKILSVSGACGNNFQNNHWIYRSSSGGDWQTTSFHNAISIDGSFQTPGVDTKTWWDRQPAQNIQAWGNGNQTHMILNDGRLGINWMTPAARLDIQETDNSKMAFIARSAHSSDNTTCIYASVSRDLTQAFLVGQNNYGGTPNNWQGTFIVYGNGKTMITTSTTDAFVVRDLSYNVKHLVKSNGQTVIGGMSQTGTHSNAMLFVNGKAVAKEIIVTSQNWADFVFDSDYKLKPLTELEEFYKENHHLPDVPSTNDIQKTGNDLGKTDAILLQKIEELTLYIVELDKKVNELQKENSALKK